jgi:hypothetical protein
LEVPCEEAIGNEIWLLRLRADWRYLLTIEHVIEQAEEVERNGVVTTLSRFDVVFGEPAIFTINLESDWP